MPGEGGRGVRACPPSRGAWVGVRGNAARHSADLGSGGFQPVAAPSLASRVRLLFAAIAVCRDYKGENWGSQLEGRKKKSYDGGDEGTISWGGFDLINGGFHPDVDGCP